MSLKEQDPNQWLRVEFERRGRMNKKIIKELRKILKKYHYDSKEQHMCKAVVTKLENLLGLVLRKSDEDIDDHRKITRIMKYE
jgi:hypothetical protein